MYYMLAPGGEYYNYSGCGNTLNCNQPVVSPGRRACMHAAWLGLGLLFAHAGPPTHTRTSQLLAEPLCVGATGVPSPPPPPPPLQVRQLVLDCLRYWVTEYHIDGFRCV